MVDHTRNRNTRMYQAWCESFERERESYAQLVTKDLFADWQTNRSPEKKAERQLNYGLEARYAGDPAQVANQFFQRCISVVDRMIAENWYPRRPRDESPPSNRAVAHRARCFATALLGGKLDVDSIAESASLFIEWALDGTWDDISQWSYLTGVRLFLIIQDLDSARKVVNRRKKFPDHPVEFNLLREIANQKAFPIANNALLPQFDEYFNPIRSPDFISPSYMERDNTRFELGIVRYRHFVNSGDINWDQVIEGISS